MTRSAAPGLLIACAILIAGLLFAFTVGRYPVGLADLFNVVAGKLTGRAADVPAAVQNVIWQVRGPRILAAALVGAALAVAGTAFQGLFRNPLVSPDILGASSGAALGAVLGIFFSLGMFAIQALAFIGGLIAVAAVYMIGSAVRSRDPILVLVLGRGDRCAARRRRRPREVSRRSLQPASGHDVLAARQPRRDRCPRSHSAVRSGRHRHRG